MTQEQHREAYREHRKLAMDALNHLVQHGHDDAIWKVYKQENKEANKHLGIAWAMQTREANKKLGYKAF